MKSYFEYQCDAEMQHLVGHVAAEFSSLLTQQRLDRFDAVLQRRTRSVLCVFEGTSHTHNISAVLRTVEGLGFQDCCFVYEHTPRFRMRDHVERGASDWLSVTRAPSVSLCATRLRAAGYNVILVTSKDFARSAAGVQQIPDIELSRHALENELGVASGQKLALVFGQEKYGVSKEWATFASVILEVPMYGFVESFNLSVTAAMVLQAVREVYNTTSMQPLSQLEQTFIKERWIARQSVRPDGSPLPMSEELLSYYWFVRSGKYFSPFSD